jgi:predicted acylesterase/phospholipase RssA
MIAAPGRNTTAASRIAAWIGQARLDPGWLSRLAILLFVLSAVLGAAACTQKFVRNGLPVDMLDEARPLGRDGLRMWGDFVTPDEIERLMIERAASLRERYAAEFAAGNTPRLHLLALSGGGPDGAFGSGVLRAWTESGTRPEFDAVSGISTGAIIAPFAYLGSDYDDVLEEVYTTMSTDDVLVKTIVLEEVYTTMSTDDVLVKTIFSGLTAGTALSSTAPLRATIAEHVTPDMLAKIAAEHAKGRLLLVGTTNLDAARPVIWNMGAIAASGHPGALELFRDVILASASIPVAFPPVFIQVEAGGQTYDEMHVDGGTTSQVTLVSPQIPIYLARQYIGHAVDRELYVIINNLIVPPYETVRPRIHKIADASVSSLIASQGIGDLYKLFAITERDNMGLHIAWIPNSFREESEEAFDPAYMRKLYDFGRGLATSGNLWSTHPPYFATPDSQEHLAGHGVGQGQNGS